jgi:hypothetical protein
MPLTFGGVPMLYHKLGTPLLIVSNTSAGRTLTPGLSSRPGSRGDQPLLNSPRQLLIARRLSLAEGKSGGRIDPRPDR